MPAKNMIKTMNPRNLSVGLVPRIVVLRDAAIRQTSGPVTVYLWMGNAANRKAKPEILCSSPESCRSLANELRIFG